MRETAFSLHTAKRLGLKHQDCIYYAAANNRAKPSASELKELFRDHIVNADSLIEKLYGVGCRTNSCVYHE